MWCVNHLVFLNVRLQLDLRFYLKSCYHHVMWLFHKGSPEFLGRVTARPKIKTATMKYEPPDFPPQLEWWDVFRGPQQAGELLAAFELLQVGQVNVYIRCLLFFFLIANTQWILKGNLKCGCWLSSHILWYFLLLRFVHFLYNYYCLWFKKYIILI